MYVCPHCGKGGVGFFSKLLANPVYPATCRLCGNSSTKCARVVWAQTAVAALFLATVPNLFSASVAYALGFVTAIIVIAIGQIGPLCRHT